MSAADDLLAELTSVGRVESEGEFTLDRDKARQKMRRFQLADPRSYVLELVQAATLKGATAMRFDIDPVEMVVSFDGQPFTLEDFDDIYSAVFTRRREPAVLARKQLALGLNAAMALEPVSITVTSGDGSGRGARLELRPGEETHDEFEAIDTELTGTRIVLRERFRAGTVVGFFKNLAGEVAEEHHLRRRCVFSRVAIDLEGRRVDRGLHVPGGAIDEIPIQADGVRGVCGLTLNRDAPATLHLVKDGVWIASMERPALTRGFVAVVDGRDLRKDVSQTNIVEDEALGRVLRAVDRGWSDALARLCERLTAGEATPDWVHDTLLGVLVRHGASMEFPPDGGGATPFIRAVRKVVLWTSTRGEPLTIDDLAAEIEAGGSVGTVRSATGFMGLLPEGRRFVVHLADEQRSAAAHTLFGASVVSVVQELTRLMRRETNRRAWLARPTEPTLPAGTWLARRPLQAEGMRGEVGVANVASPTTITLVKDGCALDELVLQDALVGLTAVVEADFEPTLMFNGAERDETVARALVAIAAELVALYATVATTGAWQAPAPGNLVEAVLDSGGHLDALLCAMAVVNLDALDLERPPAFDLGLDRDEPHPVTRRVHFRCTHRGPASLAELAALARTDGTLPVTSRFADEPELWAVVVDAESGRVLAGLFGAESLRDVSDEIERLRARRAFMALVALPIELGRDAHSHVERLDEGPIRAVVRVPLSGRCRVVRYEVVVCHQARPIAQIPIVAVEGFQAIVDASDLTPLPDFSGVEHDDALLRALQAVGRAFAAGVARVARDPNLVADPSVAAALRGIAAMVFPSRDLRTAYERVLDADLADSLHERVLELVASGQDVDALASRAARFGLQAEGGFEKLVSGFTARPITRVLLEALFPAASGTTTRHWRERAASPIEALAEAPIYQWTTGEPASFRALEREARGVLRYLSERLPAGLDIDERMVVADEVTHDALQRMLGKVRLLSGQVVVERALNARRLETAEPLEVIALEPDRALVSVRIDDGAGMTGEVGLAARHTGEALGSRSLSLLLCRERRPVGERVVDERVPAAMVGIVDDARLTLRYDLSDIVSDAAFERVVARCVEAVPELTRRLVTWMQTQSGFAWTTGRLHLIDLVVPELSGDIAGWPDRLARDAWLREACEIALVPVAGGEFVSLRELWDLLWQHEELGAISPVSDWESPPAGLPLPTVVVDSWMRAALESLFTSLTDMTEPWRDLREIERRLETLPASYVWRDEEVLVRLPVDMPRLRGELVIPREANPALEVQLTLRGKVLPTPAGHRVLRVAGHVEGEAIEVTQDLSGATVAEPERTALGKLIYALYERLVERFEHDGEYGASALEHAVIALRRELLDAGLNDAERGLYRRLHELPLLRVGGRFVSMATALLERFPELAHLKLWRPQAPSSGAISFDIETVRERAWGPDDDEVSSDEWSVVSGATPVVPVEPVTPVEPVEPVHQPPPPSPGDRLVDALRQELRAIRRHNRELLDELHLERIAVRQGRARSVARVEAGTVIVDSGHATVLAALAHADDPIWLRLVASSVYTALNLEHTGVTDHHEADFHRLLASA